MIIYLAGHGHLKEDEAVFFNFTRDRDVSYNRLMSPLYKSFTEKVLNLKQQDKKKRRRTK